MVILEQTTADFAAKLLDLGSHDPKLLVDLLRRRIRCLTRFAGGFPRSAVVRASSGCVRRGEALPRTSRQRLQHDTGLPSQHRGCDQVIMILPGGPRVCCTEKGSWLPELQRAQLCLVGAGFDEVCRP